MIKISLAILTVYLLYYAGNIVYDLFLKQDKKSNENETEEFFLSEISEEEGFVSTIGIEDVENLNTPKSFNRNPIQKEVNEITEERQDLERLRQLFESEQDLDGDDFSKESSSEINLSEAKTQPFSKEEDIQNELQEPEQEQKSSEQEFLETTVEEENSQTKESDQTIQELPIHEPQKSKDWKTMLNLSETLVQLVANHNGHKVYHSVM